MNATIVAWPSTQVALKCDEPLVDDILILDNGEEVQISKCLECEGKIKSPSCCGIEMV